jgi:CubicO group peptidase (beta-lactamase class C family)
VSRDHHDRVDARPGAAPASASRRKFLGYTGAGVLTTMLPGCGTTVDGQPYGRTIAMGQQAIQQAISNPTRPVSGVSVALLKGEAIVWQQAFGVSSVPNQTPATIQTRFNIGSVSKVIAALAAMILQDRGLITLDAPIVRYLPTFTMLSPEYAQITTRQLLSHSSGLPGTNARNLFTFSPVPGYAADTQAELANTHLKHLPGELAVYCNDGFTLIEQIVLAVTGQSYATFVESSILAPLGMTSSGYLTTVPSSGVFAYPYANDMQYQEFVNAYATGGLSSTPGDMMKLAQMFLGEGVFRGQRIVSAEGVAQMGTDQTTGLLINPSPDWRWGLGWDSVQQPALATVGVLGWEKDGGTAFFSSEFFVLPQVQMALMLTGNSGYESRKIAENILMSALQEDGTISAVPQTVGGTVPQIAASPAVADAAGIYGNFNTPLQVISNADGSLQLNQWDADTSKWTQLGSGAYQYRNDGWWWNDSDADSYRFDVVSGTDEEGTAFSYRYLMKRVAPGAGYTYLTLPLAQQLSALPALDNAWQARLGTQWKVTNESPTSTTLVLDGNMPATVSALSELPGYVLFGNNDLRYQLFVPLADDRGGMSVKVPGNFGRDLYEIRFASSNSAATLTLGSSVYAPA